MKICCFCQTLFESKTWVCPACKAGPNEGISGIVFAAPDIAEQGDGFRPEYFNELARLEVDNFWFRARNALIIDTLHTHCSDTASFLEVGCGTGNVLAAVASDFPSARLVGSEVFRVGLAFAQKRLPNVEFLQMDARRIPYCEEFDSIGAFDVLEHIDEDSLVLAQMQRALLPGGTLILTVPQHPWFWTYQDVLACHVRRYSAAELIEKVEQAGFRVVDTMSFVSLLFPLMWLSRRISRLDNSHRMDALADMRVSPVLNWLLGKVMGIEMFLVKRGLRFPVGGSVLLVAKKQ